VRGRQTKKRWRDMPWRYRLVYVHNCRWGKYCNRHNRWTIWLFGKVVYQSHWKWPEEGGRK